tara:strand:+ start:1869 stop:4865 length:2997 start_codon:yes stop_codon:yes gene_type:complete
MTSIPKIYKCPEFSLDNLDKEGEEVDTSTEKSIKEEDLSTYKLKCAAYNLDIGVGPFKSEPLTRTDLPDKWSIDEPVREIASAVVSRESHSTSNQDTSVSENSENSANIDCVSHVESDISLSSDPYISSYNNGDNASFIPRKLVIDTPTSGGGASCPAPPVNCAYRYNPDPNLDGNDPHVSRELIITQQPSNGGADCPPQPCTWTYEADSSIDPQENPDEWISKSLNKNDPGLGGRLCPPEPCQWRWSRESSEIDEVACNGLPVIEHWNNGRGLTCNNNGTKTLEILDHPDGIPTPGIRNDGVQGRSCPPFSNGHRQDFPVDCPEHECEGQWQACSLEKPYKEYEELKSAVYKRSLYDSNGIRDPSKKQCTTDEGRDVDCGDYNFKDCSSELGVTWCTANIHANNYSAADGRACRISSRFRAPQNTDFSGVFQGANPCRVVSKDCGYSSVCGESRGDSKFKMGATPIAGATTGRGHLVYRFDDFEDGISDGQPMRNTNTKYVTGLKFAVQDDFGNASNGQPFNAHHFSDDLEFWVVPGVPDEDIPANLPASQKKYISSDNAYNPDERGFRWKNIEVTQEDYNNKTIVDGNEYVKGMRVITDVPGWRSAGGIPTFIRQLLDDNDIPWDKDNYFNHFITKNKSVGAWLDREFPNSDVLFDISTSGEKSNNRHMYVMPIRRNDPLDTQNPPGQTLCKKFSSSQVENDFQMDNSSFDINNRQREIYCDNIGIGSYIKVIKSEPRCEKDATNTCQPVPGTNAFCLGYNPIEDKCKATFNHDTGMGSRSLFNAIAIGDLRVKGHDVDKHPTEGDLYVSQSLVLPTKQINNHGTTPYIPNDPNYNDVANKGSSRDYSCTNRCPLFGCSDPNEPKTADAWKNCNLGGVQNGKWVSGTGFVSNASRYISSSVRDEAYRNWRRDFGESCEIPPPSSPPLNLETAYRTECENRSRDDNCSHGFKVDGELGDECTLYINPDQCPNHEYCLSNQSICVTTLPEDAISTIPI